MVQSVKFNSIKKFKLILSATHHTSPIFQIGKKKKKDLSENPIASN